MAVFLASLFLGRVSFIGSSIGLQASWKAFIIMIRPLWLFFLDKSMFSTEKRAIRVVTDGMSIGDVVAAGPAHYKQPGPWYGIPLASITTAVEADEVMQLIESTLVGGAISEKF